MKSKKLSEQIIKTFKSNGFVLSEPDVLLDSEYIIQRSGENFRSSMLTFENDDDIKKVYDINPIQTLTKNTYDGLLIAVGHDEFKTLGENIIKN